MYSSLKCPAVVVLLCSASANPFDEDDDADTEEDFSNVVGVAVEALYDYVGQEEDELSFKQGITVLHFEAKAQVKHLNKF